MPGLSSPDRRVSSLPAPEPPRRLRLPRSSGGRLASATFLLATLVLSLGLRSRALPPNRPPFPEVPAIFPCVESNASATEVDTIAARLGIALWPKERHDHPQPTAESAKQVDDVRTSMGSHLTILASLASDEISPAPDGALAYLAAHEGDLRALEHCLTTRDVPVWEHDLERDATYMNFVGHLTLHRVLALRALQAAHEGRHDDACRTLGAALRLSEALAQRPGGFAQVISIACTRLQLGVLRKLRAGAPQLAATLAAIDPRERMRWGMRADAWSQEREVGFPRSGAGGALGRVAGRFLMEDYARALRGGLAELDADPGCAFDAQRFADRWGKKMWWFNPTNNLSFVGNAYGRAIRIRLEAELTEQVLALRDTSRAEATRRGRWTEPCRSCPEWRWLVSATPTGVAIQLDGNLPASDRYRLPLEHCLDLR